jgi:diguanylate cyclase (GGDEF)-like protein/PAS domain S-box-containing protein
LEPFPSLPIKENEPRWPNPVFFLGGYLLLLVVSSIVLYLSGASLALIILLAPPIILAIYHYPRLITYSMTAGLILCATLLAFRSDQNLPFVLETIFISTATLITMTELIRWTLEAQKKAEAGRWVSEERNRQIVETATEGIWMSDAAFNITFVNPRMATMLGYTPEQMFGQNLFNFVDQRSQAALKSQFEFQAKGPISVQDFRMQRKDGSLIWVAASARTHFDDKNQFTGTLAMITDVTGRKHIEDALKNSEERYRRLAEHAPDLMYRLRLLPNLMFEYINPRVTDLCGYTSQEFFTNPNLIYLLVHPDDLHLLAELSSRNTDFSEPIFMRWINRDQRVIWTEHHILPFPNASGLVEVVEGIARDITERKKTEDTLRESEEKFKSLANSITDIFFALDRNLHYVYWNRAVELFSGVSSEKAIGKTIHQVFPELNNSKTELVYRQVLADQQPQIVETEFVSNGRDFSFEISVYPAKNGLSVFARDITARKKAEEELRYLSTHDALTGLFNRAYFETELERLRGSRIHPISIVMADVDGLKNVNDHLGHAAGDELLREAARALREAFRSEDVVARIGGDEFGVLLPSADEESVIRAVERVAGGLSAYNSMPNRPLLMVSIGSATAINGDDLTETLKLADAHMYATKLLNRKRRES